MCLMRLGGVVGTDKENKHRKVNAAKAINGMIMLAIIGEAAILNSNNYFDMDRRKNATTWLTKAYLSNSQPFVKGFQSKTN